MLPGETRKVNACPEKILRVLPRELVEGQDGSLDVMFATPGIMERIECDCGANPKLPKMYKELGKAAAGCRASALPPNRFNNL